MAERIQRKKSGAPTIFDVAREAGVSRMTVSRVINGDAAVRPQTRERVEAVVTALNYAPSSAARTLAGGGHIRIALLHSFPNPGFLGQFLASLVEEASKVHASLLVRKVSSAVEDLPTVADLKADGVHAAILAAPLADDAELIEMLEASGITIVLTGAAGRIGRHSWVGIDDGEAAKAITRHLIATGHRRIGYIKGNPTYASTRMRLAGFREALAEARIAPDPALIVEGDYTYQSGLAAAKTLLSLHEPPTAIFASNDDMAAAVVSVAHRSGINVPEQLSVCGFDDAMLATTIWPNLTTIRRPTPEITRTAIEIIARAIAARDHAGASVPTRVQLDHLLIERDSVAPPFRPAQSPASATPDGVATGRT